MNQTDHSTSSAKTWVITGASSGLGQSLAFAALNRGDRVAATFRKPEQAEAFEARFPDRAKGIVLDVTHIDQIAKVAKDIEQAFGKIDILVNNAGFGMAGAIEETSLAEARAMFEANFFGALAITQAFLPMLRNQRQGRIFQISSHGGIKAFPGFGMYNASKFALEGMSEALAAEVAPLGIQVTIVQPGPFRTGFAGSGFQLAADRIADYDETAGTFRTKIKGVNGKQEGDPDKAADILVDLAHSDKAPLRLPLGTIPLVTIQSKLDQVQADLDANREIAALAVFE
ncbi:oxidoreductase [Pontibacter sp. G13]|uniref:oxidoreductase n=1 Tax=Pontibacter sp. G13 TaxID=3074898 RepID=UPI0028898E02|nr:oxidoreductase [Pontibacter sp. G13]WNJ18170.1 oxidoreductase [Pontibacter sp. G13]